jgi:hypothetical protein
MKQLPKRKAAGQALNSLLGNGRYCCAELAHNHLAKEKIGYIVPAALKLCPRL